MAPRRRRSNRRSRKYKGGGGASNYVNDVTSTGGRQLSVEQSGTGVGNALQYNAQGGVSSYEMPNSLNMSSIVGGRKGMKKEGGSGILTDLAVPAVLLVAQRALSKRQSQRTKKRHSYRRRR